MPPAIDCGGTWYSCKLLVDVCLRQSAIQVLWAPVWGLDTSGIWALSNNPFGELCQCFQISWQGIWSVFYL